MSRRVAGKINLYTGQYALKQIYVMLSMLQPSKESQTHGLHFSQFYMVQCMSPLYNWSITSSLCRQTDMLALQRVPALLRHAEPKLSSQMIEIAPG